MHKIVGEHVKDYIKATPDMRQFFDRLASANKKLFLVTNSPYHFVWVEIKVVTERGLIFVSSRNKGMKYLVGDDWRDLFDVVIVQARKPKFFTEHSRPLRWKSVF